MLRRDRAIVLAALALLTGLAWLYLAHLGSMHPVHQAGMDMSGMAMPADAPLAGPALALLLAMWAVMMVGMMTPSIAPMVLLYARVGRQAASKGQPFASAGWFLTGYLVAWLLFSLGATAAHAGLAAMRLVTSAMTLSSPLLGAALLILAGVYQWTPLKETCLAQCRSPLEFVQRHGGFRGDASGAVALGLRHGLYCIGCCWPLMLLLFLGGVMNLLWIAALAAIVLAEKVTGGNLFSRGAGLVMLAAGIALAVRAV